MANKQSPKKSICLRFDRGTLLLSGVECKNVHNISGPTVWAWDRRVGAFRCDAIHYTVVHKALTAQFGPSFSNEVTKPVRVEWPNINLPKLRPNQIEALEAWSGAGCRGQIIMPTGTGKTEVALAAMARTKIASLIVAPVRDLMYQWHRRILAAFEYDAGIVGRANLHSHVRQALVRRGVTGPSRPELSQRILPSSQGRITVRSGSSRIRETQRARNWLWPRRPQHCRQANARLI